MLRHLRRVLFIPIAVALLLAAAAPAAAAGATITPRHFEYDIVDYHTGVALTFHYSCDEIRFDRGSHALELINCRTNDFTQPKVVVFSSKHLFGGLYPWSSDYTGQPATDFRLVGTPAGRLFGWAYY